MSSAALQLLGQLPPETSGEGLQIVVSADRKTVTIVDPKHHQRWTTTLTPAQGEGHYTLGKGDAVVAQHTLSQLYFMDHLHWKKEPIPPVVSSSSPMPSSYAVMAPVGFEEEPVSTPIADSHPNNINNSNSPTSASPPTAGKDTPSPKEKKVTVPIKNFEEFFEKERDFCIQFIRHLSYAALSVEAVHSFITTYLAKNGTPGDYLHSVSITAIIRLFSKQDSRARRELLDPYYTVLRIQEDFEYTADRRKYADRAFYVFHRLLDQSKKGEKSTTTTNPLFRTSPEELRDLLKSIEKYVDTTVWLSRTGGVMEGLNPHSDDDSDKEEKTNKQDGHKQKQAKRERTTEEADSTDATPQKKKVKFDRFEDCEVRWENLNLANKQKSVDSSVKIFLNHVINDAWIQQHYRDTSATVKPPKRKGGGSLITSVEDYTRATTVYHLLLTRVYQPIRELLLDYIALKRRSRSWLQQRLFPMYLLPPQTSDVAHSAQDDVDKSDFTARVVEEVTAFFAQQVPLEENVCKLYFQYKKLLLQLQRDIEDYLNLKKLRVL